MFRRNPVFTEQPARINWYIGPTRPQNNTQETIGSEYPRSPNIWIPPFTTPPCPILDTATIAVGWRDPKRTAPSSSGDLNYSSMLHLNVVVLLLIPGSFPPWYHCHRDESNGDEREERREPGRVGVSMRRMVLLLVWLSVTTAAAAAVAAESGEADRYHPEQQEQNAVLY